MKVLKLECRRCAKPLTGAPNDTVFVCPECARAFPFYLWNAPTGREPESHLEPDSPVANALQYFQGQPDYPCWLFPNPAIGPDEAGSTGSGGAASGNLFDRLGGPPEERHDPSSLDGSLVEELLLPFWLFQLTPDFTSADDSKKQRYQPLERELYPLVPAFALHGMQYTGWPGQELDLTVPPVLGQATAPIQGITRDPFAAFVLAWHMIFLQADRLGDISNVRMEVQHQDTMLIAVPALRVGKKVRIFTADKEYPSIYFDDLAALRHQVISSES